MASVVFTIHYECSAWGRIESDIRVCCLNFSSFTSFFGKNEIIHYQRAIFHLFPLGETGWNLLWKREINVPIFFSGCLFPQISEDGTVTKSGSSAHLSPASFSGSDGSISTVDHVPAAILQDAIRLASFVARSPLTAAQWTGEYTHSRGKRNKVKEEEEKNGHFPSHACPSLYCAFRFSPLSLLLVRSIVSGLMDAGVFTYSFIDPSSSSSSPLGQSLSMDQHRDCEGGREILDWLHAIQQG